ncbi:MAG: pirin family protein [Chloroflexota bacterium]
MPAARPKDMLAIPRIDRPAPGARFRPVLHVVQAEQKLEGAGFPVRRPFPSVDLSAADPFLLLDHLGAIEYAPGEAKGAPWHPHRGFETVTYIMDGAFQHHDSTGGAGLIANGSTQWMTAGAGILHEEMPTEELVTTGGLFHGVQLWVNLPSSQKWNPPRYQDIPADQVALLSSHDGSSLVRLIAGELGGHRGPGVTWTPITYGHATLAPGSRLELPWRQDFSAMVYVLGGQGTVGESRRSVGEGELAVFGAGDAIVVEAAAQPEGPSKNLDVLLLGGQPIGEPVVFYGPFVMNTRQEIQQAIDDYRAGRLGRIPAEFLGEARNS